jgi:hypothetical protein
MPVDPTIRRLAADPEVVAAIKIIDRYFELFSKQRDNDPTLDPALAKVTAEDFVEDCWSLLKRGILRLRDNGDDDDDPTVRMAVNPGQRARARPIGAKLFAVRQHLRRMARRQGRSKSGEPIAAESSARLATDVPAHP